MDLRLLAGDPESVVYPPLTELLPFVALGLPGVVLAVALRGVLRSSGVRPAPATLVGVATAAALTGACALLGTVGGGGFNTALAVLPLGFLTFLAVGVATALSMRNGAGALARAAAGYFAAIVGTYFLVFGLPGTHPMSTPADDVRARVSSSAHESTKARHEELHREDALPGSRRRHLPARADRRRRLRAGT